MLTWPHTLMKSDFDYTKLTAKGITSTSFWKQTRKPHEDRKIFLYLYLCHVWNSVSSSVTVTNYLSHRMKRCPDGKFQARKARLHIGSKQRWLSVALKHSWVSPGIQGGPVPGAACGGGRRPEAVSVSRPIESWPRLGSTTGRAVCLISLNRLALLVASWPAFELLRGSSICLSLNPLRDET